MMDHQGQDVYESQYQLTCPLCSFKVGNDVIRDHLSWELDYSPFQCLFCSETFHSENASRHHLLQCAASKGISETRDKWKEDQLDHLMRNIQSNLPPAAAGISPLSPNEQQGRGNVPNVPSTSEKEKFRVDRISQIPLDTGAAAADTTSKTTEPPQLPNITVFNCEKCEIAFTTEERLARHSKRSHSEGKRKKEEKRHLCGICEKGFESKQGLNRHMRTHSGERAFECAQCEKKFTFESNLRQHQKMVHENQKEVICGVCGKRYAHASGLKYHKTSVHGGEKPYGCLICNQRFAISSSLKTHHRVHSGEKPYGCQFCQRKFARGSDCRKHETRIHTKAFPHVCSECGSGFIYRGKLRQHVNLHHVGVVG